MPIESEFLELTMFACVAIFVFHDITVIYAEFAHLRCVAIDDVDEIVRSKKVFFDYEIAEIFELRCVIKSLELSLYVH